MWCLCSTVVYVHLEHSLMWCNHVLHCMLYSWLQSFLSLEVYVLSICTVLVVQFLSLYWSQERWVGGREVARAVSDTVTHTTNCKCIYCVWKPFGICFSKLQTNWSAGDSVIHTFATLILLSSYSVIYDTLGTIDIPYANGAVSKTVVYFDPTVVAYSSEHIPYLVVAMVVCFLLAVCPALLLCLYPTRLYERLSRCCSPRKRIAIKTFAEALHSCFKNELNGTRDYRAAAGFLMIAPFPFFAVEVAVLHVIPRYVPLVVGVLFIFISVLAFCFRPCKSLISNLSLGCALWITIYWWWVVDWWSFP